MIAYAIFVCRKDRLPMPEIGGKETVMKVVKCEICGEIFFLDDGSKKDWRAFDPYICKDCKENHKDCYGEEITDAN
jgi:formylmethanofuran dehydrogenase subunit E